MRYIQVRLHTTWLTLAPRDSLIPKQLVENEEVIGTLIETNERIINAIELYDHLVTQSADTTDPSAAITSGLAATNINPPEGELSRLQERQRLAVERVKSGGSGRGGDDTSGANVHPDLQDLNFGPLGASSSYLPAPLRPSTLSDDAHGREDESHEGRGSLSDFSDYESSDEESHNARYSGRRGGRDYVDVSDDPEDHHATGARRAPDSESEADPFADPFADAGSSR